MKDTGGYISIGETDDRHWKMEIYDSDLFYKYSYVNGQIVLNDNSERKASKEKELSKEILIQNKIRDLAIKDLKKDGILDEDGELI